MEAVEGVESGGGVSLVEADEAAETVESVVLAGFEYCLKDLR